MGPGDIYTSILPNLLVEDVGEAINRSKTVKICVCNLMTKTGESDGFRASDFTKLICEYLGTSDPLDYLIVNNAPYPDKLVERYAFQKQYPVEVDSEECELRWTQSVGQNRGHVKSGSCCLKRLQ